MLKNASSKSIILAPFNSTRSDLDQINNSLSDSVKEMIQDRSCLKFAARVREVDRKYEANNNQELDNGVYHKFEEEEEKEAAPKQHSSSDSLQSSFNKESEMRSDDEEENQRIKEIRKNKKKKQTEIEKLESMIQQQEKPDIAKFQEETALKSADTLIINESIISQIEAFGYPKEYLVKALNHNELNYATTGYYLLEPKSNYAMIDWTLSLRSVILNLSI